MDAPPPQSRSEGRFQLKVVNACLSSRDIPLPTRPTPGALVTFYISNNCSDAEEAVGGGSSSRAKYSKHGSGSSNTAAAAAVANPSGGGVVTPARAIAATTSTWQEAFEAAVIARAAVANASSTIASRPSHGGDADANDNANASTDKKAKVSPPAASQRNSKRRGIPPSTTDKRKKKKQEESCTPADVVIVGDDCDGASGNSSIVLVTSGTDRSDSDTDNSSNDDDGDVVVGRQGKECSRSGCAPDSISAITATTTTTTADPNDINTINIDSGSGGGTSGTISWLRLAAQCRTWQETVADAVVGGGTSSRGRGQHNNDKEEEEGSDGRCRSTNSHNSSNQKKGKGTGKAGTKGVRKSKATPLPTNTDTDTDMVVSTPASLRLREMAEAAAAATLIDSGAVPTLRTSQWMRGVAHVVLGRHTALPEGCRLRHRNVSRLHARVVRVDHVAMHICFSTLFPSIHNNIDRDDNINDEDDDDDDTNDYRNVNAKSGDDEASAFVRPYYLLLSYGENPLFVNGRCVPPGASWPLAVGDVVSFLEDAMDAEYGCLVARPGRCAAEGSLHHNTNDDDCGDGDQDNGTSIAVSLSSSSGNDIAASDVSSAASDTLVASEADSGDDDDGGGGGRHSRLKLRKVSPARRSSSGASGSGAMRRGGHASRSKETPIEAGPPRQRQRQRGNPEDGLHPSSPSSSSAPFLEALLTAAMRTAYKGNKNQGKPSPLSSSSSLGPLHFSAGLRRYSVPSSGGDGAVEVTPSARRFVRLWLRLMSRLRQPPAVRATSSSSSSSCNSISRSGVSPTPIGTAGEEGQEGEGDTARRVHTLLRGLARELERHASIGRSPGARDDTTNSISALGDDDSDDSGLLDSDGVSGHNSNNDDDDMVDEVHSPLRARLVLDTTALRELYHTLQYEATVALAGTGTGTVQPHADVSPADHHHNHSSSGSGAGSYLAADDGNDSRSDGGGIGAVAFRATTTTNASEAEEERIATVEVISPIKLLLRQLQEERKHSAAATTTEQQQLRPAFTSKPTTSPPPESPSRRNEQDDEEEEEERRQEHVKNPIGNPTHGTSLTSTTTARATGKGASYGDGRANRSPYRRRPSPTALRLFSLQRDNDSHQEAEEEGELAAAEPKRNWRGSNSGGGLDSRNKNDNSGDEASPTLTADATVLVTLMDTRDGTAYRAVPALAIHSAALPVFVFTRRCRSPDTTTLSTRQSRAANRNTADPLSRPEYVFYYDEEEYKLQLHQQKEDSKDTRGHRHDDDDPDGNSTRRATATATAAQAAPGTGKTGATTATAAAAARAPVAHRGRQAPLEKESDMWIDESADAEAQTRSKLKQTKKKKQASTTATTTGGGGGKEGKRAAVPVTKTRAAAATKRGGRTR